MPDEAANETTADQEAARSEAEPIKVAVYFVDEEQREQIEAVLTDVDSFANVVEGTVDQQQIAALSDAGLIVEPLPGAGPPPEPDWNRSQAPVVARLAEEAQFGPLPTPPETATLASDEQPGDDFFRIELRSPITRDQRLAFDGIGVDIAAFEPPAYYRTYLTSQQYPQVEAFDFVVGITPYMFEDKLSRELVALVEDETSDRPSLAGDAASYPPQAFDCLLHRESDLPMVRELIESAADAQVVDQSNLRIRFFAPPDLPLLGQLAARPEVRKLAVYRPPTTLSGAGS